MAVKQELDCSAMRLLNSHRPDLSTHGGNEHTYFEALGDVEPTVNSQMTTTPCFQLTAVCNLM